MTKPNFAEMTKVDLRAYLVAHPSDQEAFHAFVDRFTADASPETYAMPQSKAEIEEVAKLIQQKVEELKTS
ncbi:MAG: hypothetical protein LH702_06690 [Phormidesmis sp. CAN_BIN44]|nr:hypothetical protein [Phormidesmis sp. CAN_BIN44]